MTEIFHVVPVAAAVIIFVLLASVGQLRELYLSLLEDVSDPARIGHASVAIVAAAAGFALISAAFYEAHYWLSTMRINVVYSSQSNPEIGSLLRDLQRAAAFILALIPWVGLATGMISAEVYLANRYDRLKEANIGASELDAMQQHLPAPSAWAVAAAVLVLGITLSLMLDHCRRYRIARNTIALAIPILAAALLLFLTEPRLTISNYVPLIGASTLAVVGIFYYLGYHWLRARRSDFIYLHPSRPDTGINLRRRRRIVLFVWGLVPWIVIVLYVAWKALARSPIDTPEGQTMGNAWTMVPLAATWVMAVGLWVAMVLDRFRESTALRGTVAIIVMLLLLAVEIRSLYEIDTVVATYRWIGTLGSLALGLLFLFSIFTVLAVLSQQSGFPALSLVILAIVVSTIFPVPIKITAAVLTVVCFIFAVMAALSRLWAVAVVAALLAVPGVIAWLQEPSESVDRIKKADDSKALSKRFSTWLQGRLDEANLQDPSQYPVFIIAVEGGGIYAATAASLLLAKLEERSPGFSKHVFAISGVSGGAIGATIFEALQQSAVASMTSTVGNPTAAPTASTQSTPAASGCPRSQSADRGTARQSLTQTVSKIMQDDHFSPVVGAIVPQLLGAPSGRAEALEASFSRSVCEQDTVAGRELAKPFADHWSETSQAPALVLNATWAETGLRVAFAPFPLHATDKDKSLYSFLDKYMPIQDAKFSLIKAAVVSARFPAILPPYSIPVKPITTDAGTKEAQPTQAGEGPSLWNFVDGGYSDSSGASTALALYRELEAQSRGPRPQIRIILLTSASPPDLGEKGAKIHGTAFRDTLAPIAAVVNVRERLGNQAVARVCDHFPDSSNCKDKVNNSRSDTLLKIVEIEDQTYGLPLGWKLSRSTVDVVSWMLGQPRDCDRTAGSQLEPGNEKASELERQQLNQKTVRSNSCVLQSVADLLTRK